MVKNPIIFLRLRVSRATDLFYITPKDLKDALNAGPRFVIGVPERLSADEGNPNGRTVAILLFPTEDGNYAVDEATVMAVLMAKPKAIRFIVPGCGCLARHYWAECDALLLPNHEWTFPSRFYEDFYKNFRPDIDEEVKEDDYVSSLRSLLGYTWKEATLGIGYGALLLAYDHGICLENLKGHDNEACATHEVKLFQSDSGHPTLLYTIMDEGTIRVKSHIKEVLNKDSCIHSCFPQLCISGLSSDGHIEAFECSAYRENRIGILWDAEQMVCEGDNQMLKLFEWLTTKPADEEATSL